MEKRTSFQIKWYHYFLAILAGMFLVNATPHFINGISGIAFPTPFANPPGEGLSSPQVNMLWSFTNAVLGSLLFVFGKVNKRRILLLIFGISFFVIGYLLASHFGSVAH